MKDKKVAAVVVTYNRKHDLIKCLHSIFEQSRSVVKLFIIDNDSSDGTPQFLIEEGVLKKLPSSSKGKDMSCSEIRELKNGKKIEVIYVRKFKNDGGAGGFYKGMKLAHEAKSDWIWLMDDDGIADKDQLKNLLKYCNEYGFDYVNALVLNLEDENKLSFGLKGYKYFNDIKEKDIIDDYVNPFNGTLIAKSVIDKIGMIKKEMFIWGDEREYTSRVRSNGYKIATILSAKHYHPMDKGITKSVFPFYNKFLVVIKPEHLEHIYYRNLGYLEGLYANKKIRIVTRISYVSFFILKFKLGRALKFLKHYSKGLKNDFN